MLIDIVQDIETDRTHRMILHEMASKFQHGLPDTLYLNQYELSESFGFTPNEWNEFLRYPDVDRFIEQEIAQIAEIGARNALSNLMKGEANSADIQAARELLSRSKLIQQRQNQREQVVILRIPPKEKEESTDEL